MELSEILQKLMERFNANSDEVLAAVQNHAQALYQRAFDNGHRAGFAKGKTDKESVEAQLQTANTKLTAVETELSELKKKTPDVAAVEDRYKREIAELTTKHTNEILAEKNASKTSERNRILTELETRLTGRLNPLYTKLLKQDKDVIDRIHVRDDRSVEIMQAGKEIPFSPAAGKSAVDLLAEELVSAAPADYKLEEADAGSGITRGNTTGGNGGGKSSFDRIRDKKKAELEAQKAAGGKSVEEKLGMGGISVTA